VENALQDLSAAALIEAIEANLFALFAHFRSWPRADVHENSEISWCITDIPFPLFNSVLHARLAPENVAAAIKAAKSRCRSKRVPMLWWTGPATRPTDLGKHLLAHGFVHAADSAGMAVDLLALNEDQSAPESLAIERVRDVEALKQFADTLRTAFEMPDFVAGAMVDLFAGMGFDHQLPLRHYIGRLEGECAGVASLLLGAGVAGIYNVGTVPSARRKGIGAAMTVMALLEARALGYRVGILHASKLGFGVYRRLGFLERCKIGHYVWAGEPASQDAGQRVNKLPTRRM
jgi:GNAT superfamily N-acetyltransferase